MAAERRQTNEKCHILESRGEKEGAHGKYGRSLISRVSGRSEQ